LAELGYGATAAADESRNHVPIGETSSAESGLA
jgi:hypothetical protein